MQELRGPEASESVIESRAPSATAGDVSVGVGAGAVAGGVAESVLRVGTGAGALAAGVGASGRGSVSAGIEALTGMRVGAGAGGAGVSAEAGAEVGTVAVEVEGAWAVRQRIVVQSAGTSTKNRGFLAPARPGHSEASAGE